MKLFYENIRLILTVLYRNFHFLSVNKWLEHIATVPPHIGPPRRGENFCKIIAVNVL